MIGCISIDFRPSRDAVPGILDVVDREGFALRGIRLMPSASEDRSTLRVDIGGCPSRPRLDSLQSQLMALEPTIEVIHVAGAAHA